MLASLWATVKLNHYTDPFYLCLTGLDAFELSLVFSSV